MSEFEFDPRYQVREPYLVGYDPRTGREWLIRLPRRERFLSCECPECCPRTSRFPKAERMIEREEWAE